MNDPLLTLNAFFMEQGPWLTLVFAGCAALDRRWDGLALCLFTAGVQFWARAEWRKWR